MVTPSGIYTSHTQTEELLYKNMDNLPKSLVFQGC